MLNIHNLSVSFQGTYLFEKITFQLSGGTRVGLVGKNGAGKSTFLEHLEKNIGKNSGWIFLREPVHIWEQIKDENGETVLANFYKNPEKYSYDFQIY